MVKQTKQVEPVNHNLDEKISENIEEIERKKEEKLLNLIADFIIKKTLKEFYEAGN